jgi:hypothetical protein
MFTAFCNISPVTYYFATDKRFTAFCKHFVWYPSNSYNKRQKKRKTNLAFFIMPVAYAKVAL